MDSPRGAIHGRGACSNPPNRFEKITFVPAVDVEDPEGPGPRTQFGSDRTSRIITRNDSPDIPFDASVNPYRGCEHGCAYCYARPTHEYFGLSAGLDFESRILIKERAPELLRKELSSRKWRPQTIALSGVTDPYQPVERQRKLSRRCLEVLAEARNPVVIITKNFLVTRDIDLLQDLAKHNAVGVFLSVTTLDEKLVGDLEPRTSRPGRRLDAVDRLRQAGIPTGVLISPVIPGLTEHEIPAIIKTAAERGAQFAGFGILRLPYAVAPLFEAWLEQHQPDRKQKVLNRVREIRGGKLNESEFGSRMKGHGVFARQIADLFQMGCRRAGIEVRLPELSVDAFRTPPGPQRMLFD